MTGKHSINLYIDFDNENAGCFITGHYKAQKSMLIAAAKENPSFGEALLDAAVKYLDYLDDDDLYYTKLEKGDES